MTEYNVGYKKPPVSHQFKKGQSGNPNGRRKGSLNFKKVFNNEINSKITLTNGETITKGEAMIKQMINSAALGNEKSTKTVMPILMNMDKDKLNEKFVKKMKEEFGLSDKDVQNYTQNGEIYLNSTKVFDVISKDHILDYNIALANVRTNCLLATIYYLDYVIDLANNIYRTICEECFFWDDLEEFFYDANVDEETQKTLISKYEKEREYKRPSYELFVLSFRFLLFFMDYRRNKYIEMSNESEELRFYNRAEKEFFSESRCKKAYKIYAAKHPEYKGNEKEEMEDFKILKEKYHNFKRVKPYDLKVLDEIRKIKLEEFDPVIHWYFDKKKLDS